MHGVTLLEAAAAQLRSRLDNHVELTDTLDAHLARAAAALSALEDRASKAQQRVLQAEQAMTKRIENDTAVLLEQLASRLKPLKNNVEDVQRSLNDVIRQSRTVANDPRELVQHFPAIQAKVQRLSELTAEINVDEIESQHVDVRPTSLTDWIPLDSLSLVGRLTSSSSDHINDPLTLNQLREQLEAAQKRESSLLVDLEKAKEQQKLVVDLFSEQATLHKLQETRASERDNRLCQYIEMLRAILAQMGHSERTLAQGLELAALEKTELERKMAVQGEQLAEASRRISELEMRAEELEGQMNASELRQRDLEERLRTETKWRRDAEAESRERRHQNE